MAAIVTFVNKNDYSQWMKASLFGPTKNRVRVATVAGFFQCSIMQMSDGSVLEVEEDGLSLQMFVAGGTYTLLLVPQAPSAGQDVVSQTVHAIYDIVVKTSDMHASEIQAVRDIMVKTSDMFLRCQFPPTGTSEQSANYRRNTMSRYMGSERAEGKVFCMMTGCWYPESVTVTAGHIYMKKWPPNYLEEIFGVKVHAPENIIFLLEWIEKRFDAFQLCVVPEDEDVFRIKVLNPDLFSTKIHPTLDITFGGLHNQALSFVTAARPSKRLCGFRAKLAIKHAEGKGWVERGDVVVPDGAWMSPTFDRKLLDRFMHDLDPENGMDGSGRGPERELQIALEEAFLGDFSLGEHSSST